MNVRSMCAVAIAAGLLAAPAFAANVGYYDMGAGEGVANQVAPISAAGHTPVQIFDLSPAELSGIAVLMVQNGSNGSYGGEYLAALADIQQAVLNGMGLVIHDRFVDDAETILPGGGAFDIIRDTGTNTSDINILDNGTLVTNGPGGMLDDTSLDGGNLSSHGYAVAGSLPGAGRFILSRPDPAQIVSFSYSFGAGGVFYSSIPLDFYLGGAGTNPPADAMRDIYAVNVVAFAVQGAFGSRGPSIPVPVFGLPGLLLLILALGWVAHRRLRTV